MYTTAFENHGTGKRRWGVLGTGNWAHIPPFFFSLPADVEWDKKIGEDDNMQGNSCRTGGGPPRYWQKKYNTHTEEIEQNLTGKCLDRICITKKKIARSSRWPIECQAEISMLICYGDPWGSLGSPNATCRGQDSGRSVIKNPERTSDGLSGFHDRLNITPSASSCLSSQNPPSSKTAVRGLEKKNAEKPRRLCKPLLRSKHTASLTKL